MIYCNDCGAVFEYAVMPPYYRDGIPVKDEFPTCPACGSDDISEAARCRICGEWESQADLSYGVCRDCEDDLIKRFTEVIAQEFTPDEVEAMRELEIGL